MNRKKRLLPLLMALLLIVSYLPVMRSYAAGTYTVKIDESHGACEASDGTFTYKDGTSVMGTMKIVSSDTGKGFQQSSKQIEEVQENTVFTITVTPSEGYQVTLRLNGNTVPLTGGEGRTMTGTITATGADQNLGIEAQFTRSGGQGSGGDPNPGGPSPSGSVTLQLEGNAFSGSASDFYNELKQADPRFEIYADAGSGYKTMSQLVTDSVVTSKGNGVYEFKTEITPVKVYITYDVANYDLSAFGGITIGNTESTAASITAGMQHIQIDKKSETLTVTWAYDSDSFGSDAYLEHGKAQITAIEGVSDFSTLFGANPGDAKGGNIAVPAGKKVTIKLVPDYGYQVAGLQLNGGVTLQPDDAQTSTFTFVMGNSPVHMKGIFTKVSDTVNSNSKQIEAASITNGANAAASGNLRLTVSDAESYDTTAAQALVSGAQSAQAVDLKLDQIVSKGNGSNWENNITEFEKPVTLNLALDNYDANYDYTVVRNHNGKLTELSTTVEQGTISFETNQFSTYIIVKKSKAASVDKPSTTPSTTTPSTTPAAPDTDVTKPAAKDTAPAKTNNTASPKTGDAMPVAGMMLVLAGSLTGYVVIRRKRR